MVDKKHVSKSLYLAAGMLKCQGNFAGLRITEELPVGG